MTQPTLFDAHTTPYGVTYSGHAAVTTPQHDTDLDARFAEWITANPQVLVEFIRRALDYQRAGYRTLRGKRIIEDMRDDYQAHIDTGGEPWKLNNTYTSRLVRAAEADCPQLAGCFEQRELRS